MVIEFRGLRVAMAVGVGVAARKERTKVRREWSKDLGQRRRPKSTTRVVTGCGVFMPNKEAAKLSILSVDFLGT